MHIHCFTSIVLEKVPCEGEDDETILDEGKDSDDSDIDDDIVEEYKKYRFTRIAIDYEDVLYEDQNKQRVTIQEYHMEIFRPPCDHEWIKMEPGTINITKDGKKDFIISLKFGENVHSSEKVLLKTMNIRNIKNVTNLTNINEDEDIYNEYLERVLKYQQKNHGCTIETAFDKEKMERNVCEKTLKQTILAFCRAVIDICDPINGSSKNIRYKSKFRDTNHYKTIRITNQKEYQLQKIKNKKNWRYLEFNSVVMERFDEEWFDASYLNKLYLIDIDIVDQSPEAWKAFSEGLHQLKHLHSFYIRGDNKCSWNQLPDDIFRKLPSSLRILTIARTNLKSIPREICYLTNLNGLYLMDNSMLDDDGFPWEYLPQTIEELNLSNTAITKIPEFNGRLKRLVLKGTKLKSIAWTSFLKLKEFRAGIEGNFDEINISNMLKLKEFEISNASNTIINTARFPSSVSNFVFCNSGLENFIFTSNLSLAHLDLSNNKLKTFPWEAIPQTLNTLILSNNELEHIGNISDWIHLMDVDFSFNKVVSFQCDVSDDLQNKVFHKFGMNLNLSHNHLQTLPQNFEKIYTIRRLNLSKNKFSVSHLDEFLWNRLPQKNLEHLCISQNDLGFLSCTLKTFCLRYLDARECNLFYVCPQIFNKPRSFEFAIDLRKNSQLKNLSCVPKIIFSLDNETPYYKIEKMPTDGNDENLAYVSNTTAILTDISYRTTDKFQTRKKRLFFEFENSDNSSTKNYYCRCCARCGESTEENMVQQLMTMDISIIEEGRVNKLWKAKEWRSYIKTRLCEECKTWYKTKAQNHITGNEMDNLLKRISSSKLSHVKSDDDKNNMIQRCEKRQRSVEAGLTNKLAPIEELGRQIKEKRTAIDIRQNISDTPAIPLEPSSSLHSETQFINAQNAHSIYADTMYEYSQLYDPFNRNITFTEEIEKSQPLTTETEVCFANTTFSASLEQQTFYQPSDGHNAGNNSEREYFFYNPEVQNYDAIYYNHQHPCVTDQLYNHQYNGMLPHDTYLETQNSNNITSFQFHNVAPPFQLYSNQQSFEHPQYPDEINESDGAEFTAKHFTSL